MNASSVVIIGLGGIGSWLVAPLTRYLAEQKYENEVYLVDGDHFSASNVHRQDTDTTELNVSKAEAMVSRVIQAVPALKLRSMKEFVTESNVGFIKDNSVVITAVDNHPARAVVARHADTLRNIVLLTAGNELYDGNVHITVKRDGVYEKEPLLRRHPEIAEIKTGDRAKMGCAELIKQGEPQLIFTNFMAASAVLNAFYLIWERPLYGGKRVLIPQEVYFDLNKAAVAAV
jgi:predicted ThiF/HesA family dinucleotide-utilizing enzyme